MESYLFVLGRTTELAFLELSSLFPSVVRVSSSVAGCDTSVLGNLTTADLMALVGGCTKIARLLATTGSVDPEQLVSYLDTRTSPVYGVSFYDGASFPGIAQSMKKILHNKGISSRYVESSTSPVLSSVVSTKEHVQELIIIKTTEGYAVGNVIAVQPFEEWNRRDYSRPYADPKLGMLPPKVSRMAVNCALGLHAAGKTLLDPFCGMGTVLGEAMLRGATIVGNDLSEEVVKKAEENIRWLRGVYQRRAEEPDRFIYGDATHISDTVATKSIDAIVTEPFMGAVWERSGSSVVDVKKIKNRMKGLEMLYIGCLKDWYNVLKPGGTIFMALPEYSLGGRTYFVKKVIDTCETFGYTKRVGPIEYSRPQAIVKREFFLFTKAV